MRRQMVTGGAAKSNCPSNGGLVGIENLGPHPSKRLISDLILLSHARIVRPRLLVRKNSKEP